MANSELVQQLQQVQQRLEPQLKALRQATAALQVATKLANDEKRDALPMQKALEKLQQAATLVEDEGMQVATEGFAAETQSALEELAFTFARDLRDAFQQRGEEVAGRPPTLVVGSLVLQIDVAARKGQWFYGKEALTRPLPLSLSAIMQAYDQQRKLIVNRALENKEGFLQEIHKAWQKELDERPRRGNRVNIVETYSRLVMNRQSGRFWNAPSRSTFKDYERPYFVRDLALVQEAGSPVITVDGKAYRLRLGVATKSQADQASRSIWLPSGPLDGEYYADVTFEED